MTFYFSALFKDAPSFDLSRDWYYTRKDGWVLAVPRRPENAAHQALLPARYRKDQDDDHDER